MTGLQLYALLRRRLAEAGVTVAAEREAELYDSLTAARDRLKMAFADAAPIVVRENVTLEEDGADDRLHAFPAATNDPLQVLEVRELTTREKFDASGHLNHDGGEYSWENTRQLRLADEADSGDGVEVVAVLMGDDISSATTEAQVGLPTPCHRAIAYGAAVLALTVDEESDAGVAAKLYQAELELLVNIYSSFDRQGGGALRAAFMQTLGAQYSDTIY